MKQVKGTHTFLQTKTLKCFRASSRKQLERCRLSSAVDAYSNLSSWSGEIMEMGSVCVSVCVRVCVSVCLHFTHKVDFFCFFEKRAHLVWFLHRSNVKNTKIKKLSNETQAL